MKRLLIMAFVLLGTSAFAQKDTIGLNIPVTANGIVYEKVFSAPGMSKKLLYSNARVFLIKEQKDRPGNELHDSVLYRVVGKENQSITTQQKGLFAAAATYDFDFILQIDCKDNKYRCRIYNIVLADNITPATGGAATHTYTSTDDMLAALAAGQGVQYYNKNNIKNIFTVMKAMVDNEMWAIQSTLADKDDF